MTYINDSLYQITIALFINISNNKISIKDEDDDDDDEDDNDDDEVDDLFKIQGVLFFLSKCVTVARYLT